MSCTKNTKEELNWQYKQEFYYGALPEEALQRYGEYCWELGTGNCCTHATTRIFIYF